MDIIIPSKNNKTDFLLGFIIAIDPQSKNPIPIKNTKYSIIVLANINPLKDANIIDATIGNIILLSV